MWYRSFYAGGYIRKWGRLSLVRLLVWSSSSSSLPCSLASLECSELGKMVAPVVGRPLTQVLVSETKRNWPFVVGFAVTFTLVAKLSASLDQRAECAIIGSGRFIVVIWSADCDGC